MTDQTVSAPWYRSRRNFGLFIGIVAAALWGLDTTLLDQAYNYFPMNSENYPGLTVGAASTMLHDLCSFIVVVFIVVTRGMFQKVRQAFSTKGVFWMCLAAVFGGPIGMLGYLLAINYIGPSYTAAISSLYPAVAAFFAFLLLGDKLLKVGWMGLAIAIIGTVGTSLTAILVGGNAFVSPILGVITALMCVFGWGIECVIVDYTFRNYDMDPIAAYFIRQLVSVSVYNVIVLPGLCHDAYPFLRDIFHSDCIYWIIPAGICGGLFSWSFYTSINRLGATQAIAINITYAIWTIIFSLFFKVYPSNLLIILICIVCISCGSFMCSGLGKEPYPWILLKSWVNKASEQELSLMEAARNPSPSNEVSESAGVESGSATKLGN